MLEAFNDDDIFVEPCIRQWLKWDEESESYIWAYEMLVVGRHLRQAVKDLQRRYPGLFPELEGF